MSIATVLGLLKGKVIECYYWFQSSIPEFEADDIEVVFGTLMQISQCPIPISVTDFENETTITYDQRTRCRMYRQRMEEKHLKECNDLKMISRGVTLKEVADLKFVTECSGLCEHNAQKQEVEEALEAPLAVEEKADSDSDPTQQMGKITIHDS